MAAIQIIVGVLFYRPTDNFLRITSTSGSDIPELMTAYRELANALKIIFALGVVGTVLIVLAALP